MRRDVVGWAGVAQDASLELRPPSAAFPWCPWVGPRRICVPPGPVTGTT